MGETHLLLGLDEDDAEEDPDLPFITPMSLQRYNRRGNDYTQFTNGKPPRWFRTRPSRHFRASLVRLFGPVRSLLYPTMARAACTITFLLFMLCFAFCTTKPPSTSETHPGPKAGQTQLAQGHPVETPIFKVGSTLFQTKNNTDAFIS
jgi:hypothetical protein